MQTIVAALKMATAAAMHTVMLLASEARLAASHAQTTNKTGQKRMSTAAVGGAMRAQRTRCATWTPIAEATSALTLILQALRQTSGALAAATD